MVKVEITGKYHRNKPIFEIEKEIRKNLINELEIRLARLELIKRLKIDKDLIELREYFYLYNNIKLYFELKEVDK